MLQPSYSTINDSFDYSLTLAFLALAIYTPFAIALFNMQNIIYTMDDIPKQYHTIFVDLDVSRKETLYFNTVFTGRRLTFIAVGIFLANYENI